MSIETIAAATPAPVPPSVTSPFSEDMEDMLAVRVVKKSVTLLVGVAVAAFGVAGAFGWQLKSEVEREKRQLDSTAVAAQLALAQTRQAAERFTDSLRLLIKESEERNAIEKELFGAYQRTFTEQLGTTARELGRVTQQSADAGRLVATVRDSTLPQVLRVGGEAVTTARAVGDTMRHYITSTRGTLDTLRGEIGSIQTKVLGSASLVLKGGSAVDVHGVGIRLRYKGIDDGALRGLVVEDLETGSVLLPARDLAVGRSVAFSSDRSTYRLTAQYRVRGRWLGRSMIGMSVEKYVRDGAGASGVAGR